MTKPTWLAPATALAGAALLALLQPGCGPGAAQVRNEFNWYEPSNVKGLDPINANTTYSHRVASEIFEGLLQYKYLVRPYEVEPQLAEALPEVSPDGLVYTFKLKKGVKFHDGNEVFAEGKARSVTAHDFVWSWKRLAHAQALSESYWVLEHKVVGLDEWREYTKTVAVGEGAPDEATKARLKAFRTQPGQDYGDWGVWDARLKQVREATWLELTDWDQPVEGLKARDDHTFQVRLIKPYPQLLYILTMGPTKVVPREGVQYWGDQFMNNPVGTGPFAFSKWVKGSKIVLKRNEDWRHETYPSEGEAEDQQNGMLADAGKKIPFVDRININIMIEAQPRFLKFMRGQLDAIAPDKDNYDEVMPAGKLSPEMKAMGLRSYQLPRMDITYTTFNMTDPVVGAPGGEKALAIRRAMSMAIDRDKMIRLLYNDRAIKAKGPIPPGLDGYQAEWQNPYAEYNPEEAIRILKEAYPDGNIPTIKYSHTSGSSGRQFFEFYKKYYGAVGLNVESDASTWPELDRKVRTRRAQVYGMAWQGDYPDAENFLQLFYGPRAAPGPNGSNFNDPEFNRLFEEASVMLPGPERTRLYYKMVEIIARECPWSYGVHRKSDTMVHSWLQNYKPHDAGHGNFKYYRIDMDRKQEIVPKL